jgi:hypothetical protein
MTVRYTAVRNIVTPIVLVLCAGRLGVSAADSTDPDLERRFTATVRPFVESYCAGGHSGAKPAAQLDLRAYTSMAAVVRDYPRWERVSDKLTAKQMRQPQGPDADLHVPAGQRERYEAAFARFGGDQIPLAETIYRGSAIWGLSGQAWRQAPEIYKPVLQRS